MFFFRIFTVFKQSPKTAYLPLPLQLAADVAAATGQLQAAQAEAAAARAEAERCAHALDSVQVGAGGAGFVAAF